MAKIYTKSAENSGTTAKRSRTGTAKKQMNKQIYEAQPQS